ncbi:hypothetical protein A3F86_02120 [candidate division WOR-1 bacterium RIFCSPLOWO2_12_FULL_45_9]|uniref:FdhC protein n=2 Tax=Saganbacteria TaxID=1703751 RepID=A0A1F4RPS1_UNCSA|nr:MAG: hypothetical protein A3F86_02120 [candidate division WOR-1 bacterium RIFCSPLOWO2_12_FULL_45_9]
MRESNFFAPQEIAQNLLAIGKIKCSLNFSTVFILSVLAGVYIAIGAQLATMVTHDLAKFAGAGLTRFVGGSVFSLGLMLVVIGGAELFTGNSLLMTGVVKGEIPLPVMLKNWLIVFGGNLLGSLLMVAVMFATGLWAVSSFEVGGRALMLAYDKVNLPFWAAFSRGVLCNMLVCLAIWLSLASKDIAGKILAIYFPIMAFVASGFEHSVANMYFIPMGILLKSQPAVVGMSGLAGDLEKLTWLGFLGNLLPVTLGNIVGGAFFVGAVYAFAYLRESG